MAQLEAAGILSSQQQPLPTSSPQHSQTMGAHDPAQPLTTQGNQATIHDFLSLCGTGASSTSTTTMSNHGLQQSSTTHDFLQPLQKSLGPAANSSNNLLPNGFVLNASKPYTSSNEPGGAQQSCYTFGNGSFELRESFPSKYRSANISFGLKGQVAHAVPLNKHWQQQAGIEVLEGNKRLSRVPSEEDDDEDDESYDHIYSAKKDGRYQKGEITPPMDGRNQDKGATPRSKHSATEQRRRSKINDRFQMLRQLLPNADQKRDKASFLLEVIEYIQMLHEKVKKYEGSEFRGQHQERTKILSWDRSSGQQDMTYSSAQDMKEVPDGNGYLRSRLSPLRVMSEDGLTSAGLMCTMVQASAMPGVPSFESKPLITKPIPLTISQAPAASMLEQASNHMHHSIVPEGQTVFGQLLRQEEQATAKARDLLLNKAETIPSHTQPSRNMLIPQEPHQVTEQRFPSAQSMDHQSSSTLNFRRLEGEADGRIRSNQVMDVGANSGKDFNRPSFGLGRPVLGVSEGSRIEQIAPGNDQEAPAVLGGVINISSAYSQGLLDTLTRALQSSGVDLAQATISVQIDLGKPDSSNSKQMISLPTGVLPLQNMSAHEPEPAKKKLKMEVD
ncbi:hypothetical protein GOP47_0016306 [Adiantum capillus-veneris]|uniref:BHLH domain-containing protein n=1 Tax=Adiantum capillus-veneris TaxID=13818 RepID=A0A9D4ZCU5_ADICA|nr:hypothetical protein GOP47_0016306 [Adiantum capillus-veneris]